MKGREATLARPVAKGSDSAILCVDDEPRILAALGRTLGRDYEILRAEDGDTALRLLEESTIKVVVADQRMPGMSGSELLTEIRRRWPMVGRSILTAYPGQEVMVRGMEAEVDFLMTKPWDDEKLRGAIRRLVSEVDRAREIRPGDGGWELGGEG